jgi:glutathione S-transferase
MRNLTSPDMLLVALISLFSVMLCFWLLLAVARARATYKIAAPAMTGDPAFERVARVHANTLESLLPFLVPLWLCALLFSPLAAVVLGFVWLIVRIWYALAYRRDAAKRSLPFTLSMVATGLLIIAALIGIVRDFMLAS